ncbi:carbohydrate abc transporter atp-binding cut1 family [Leptolyngbya sp. Heron Island J]|uniref:ABC transporter ATP-binding protein n=1 Tax=Leptolyngbya sp. Heron Island J TaxID=1385935 RepID=UPI0003B96375|nr:ABC transporter ATP-binding protein [Leptolyngbya sp. Heron Island J]ESA32576.1 carbohydrate abc transporter atp-binding cut1 family [Leptolyngbya sp. Heron Island J]
MAEVVIDNVYKTFPRQSSDAKPATVLKRIHLNVEDGEFMVLVGPSGCGKSTLLRLMAGLESVTGGTITIGKQRVNDLPPKQRDVAMVFQSYALYPHLSVYDNLAFGLRRTASNLPPITRWQQALFGITRLLPPGFHYWPEREQAISKRVKTIAEILQITPLLKRLPRQLSGGQKQRVALGRAMARNPQVFLMDEPLSNLDAKLRTETRAQIVALQRQLGTTTIYVTHDQVEAMTMGDRIAVMHQGVIQQIAAPLELYRAPVNQFVAAFIGSPPMNFLTVQVQAPLTLVHPAFRVTLPSHWEPILSPYHDRSLTLGIRPEHLRLTVPAPKHLEVTVQRVEALGSETYLTVGLNAPSSPAGLSDDPMLLVRLDGMIDNPPRPDDQLTLGIRVEHIHLFDSDTGETIVKAPSVLGVEA